MEVSNYIKMRDQMQERFLTYDQKATHHILQTGSYITRYTDNSQSGSRSIAGSNIDSHQSS